MPLLTLARAFMLILALGPVLSGCQNMQLGASPIPVIAYTTTLSN